MNKFLAAAAAFLTMAFFAVSASAVTLSLTNNIVDTGTYDITAGPYFWGADFFGGDAGGSVSFTFDNAAASPSTVGVTQGSVLQFTGLFTGGVTASWGLGQSITIAEGVNGLFNISSLLLAGTSDILTISWGAVQSTGGVANIDLSVAAVPLPAGFLLMGTALAGLGLVRRRRKLAA